MSLVVRRQSLNHNIWWCYRRVLPHMLWFGCDLPLLQKLPHGGSLVHAQSWGTGWEILQWRGLCYRPE